MNDNDYHADPDLLRPWRKRQAEQDAALRARLDAAGICTLCFGVGVNAFYPGPCFKCSGEPRKAPRWCNPADTLYDLAGGTE